MNPWCKINKTTPIIQFYNRENDTSDDTRNINNDEIKNITIDDTRNNTNDDTNDDASNNTNDDTKRNTNDDTKNDTSDDTKINTNNDTKNDTNDSQHLLQNPVDFETPKNTLSNKRQPGRPTNRDSLVLHRSSSTCSNKELFSKRKRGLEESFEKSFLDETAFCIGSAKKKINKEDSDLSDSFDQDDLLATSSPTDMATEKILSEIKKIRVDAAEKFESLSTLITVKVDQVNQ